MAIKIYKKTTPGSRLKSTLVNEDLSKDRPERSLTKGKVKGHRAGGKRLTTRHKGGGHKRLFRKVDFKRNKSGVTGRVVSIEYDPNRTADISLVNYSDGDKRYILSPVGLKVDAIVESGPKAAVRVGNSLPLSKIPVGTQIHNIELEPKGGAKMVRSAGTFAVISSKEGSYANVKLPSGEVRRIHIDAYATIGQLGNLDLKNVKLGKAGRSRHKNIRPTVRGVAQNPVDHPHGGGEGKSGIGMPSPKSKWGKKTLGKKTRNRRNFSNKYIVTKRSKK